MRIAKFIPLSKKFCTFVVDDLDYELAHRGFKQLGKPGSPSGGVRVAMIEYNGAPVELMEFEK